MKWTEGHPPHWCAEIVALGYPPPPEKHVFVNGSCVYCGHTEYEWKALSAFLAENPGKNPDDDGWELVGGALRRVKSSAETPRQGCVE